MNMRWSWMLGLVAGLGLAAGCASMKTASDDEVLGRMSGRRLRIGVTPDFPPIIFKQNKVITGVEADLAMNMAFRLRMKPQWVELEWEQLIPALLAGKIDVIMSGMTVTPERRMRVAFSAPYLKVGQMALVRRKDAGRFSTLNDLMAFDGRVGYQKGTTGDQFVQQHFPRAARVGYLSAGDAAVDLCRKRVDVVIQDAPQIRWLASEYASELTVFETPLTEENLAWAVRREDTDLLAAINQLVRDWNTDGTFDTILEKWLLLIK